MYGTFVNTDVLAIPDDGTVVDSSVEVFDLATVPVDVVLEIDIDHPRMSDLVLSISNFNGYGETLWFHEDTPETEIIVYAFPGDDAVNGTYTVSLSDDVPGMEGSLESWSLFIVSNWD
jgi:subtilisin-like proprotein convertase family protein